MFIVDQERKNIINIDNVLNIGIDDDAICVYTHVKCIILGIHPPNRAQEVFKELLNVAFPPNTFVCQNCEMSDLAEIEKQARKTPLFVQCQGDATIQRFDIGVYYMPEK